MGVQAMKHAALLQEWSERIGECRSSTIRAERFCDGVLLEFFKNGCISKWLSRLQEIDQQQSMN